MLRLHDFQDLNIEVEVSSAGMNPSEPSYGTSVGSCGYGETYIARFMSNYITRPEEGPLPCFDHLGTHDGTRANLSGLGPDVESRMMLSCRASVQKFLAVLGRRRFGKCMLQSASTYCCMFERHKICAVLNLRCILLLCRPSTRTLTDVRFLLSEGNVKYVLQIGLTLWM